MKFLNYSEKNQVGYVVLNRPEIHNAFDDQLIREIKEIFQKLCQEKTVRAVVLTGEGKSFCAGADLNWMKRMKDYSYEENLADAMELAEMMEAIYTCSLPTVARVQGNAFGGGVGLIAACDFTLGLNECKFGFTEARLGLAPACIAQAVVARIGSREARKLFLTAEVFSGVQAKEIKLIDTLVAGLEELDQAVEQLLTRLKKCSPEAQTISKQLAQKIGFMSLKEANDFGAASISKLRVSPLGQEGLAAFLEKRKPSWTSTQ